MKKFFLTVLLAGMFLACSSCSNTNGVTNREAEANADNSAAAAVTNDAGKDRDSFKPLPDEANNAFNTVINAAKNIYPISSGINRQYGYKGKEKIDGVECYLFSVYDFDGDNNSVKVCDLAKAVNAESIFRISDSGYEPIEVESDKYKLTLSKKAPTPDKLIKNSLKYTIDNIVSQ